MHFRTAGILTLGLLLMAVEAHTQPATLVKDDYNVDLAPQGTEATAPAIDIDSDGRIGYIWSDNRTGFPDIFVRIDAPLSASVEVQPTFTSDTTPINESMDPACAFDFNNFLATAWTADAVSPTVQEVLATWVEPDGSKTPVAGLFINQQFTADTVDAMNPTIGTDSTGQTTFLWSDNRAFADVGGEQRQFNDIWGARLRFSNGTPTFQDNEDFRINSSFTTRDGAQHPRVAVNNSDVYIVTWDEDRVALDDTQDPPLRKDIFMRMFAQDFDFDPAATIVNDMTVTLEDTGSEDAMFPDVAVNDNGLILFVWQNEATGDPGDIRLRLFSANGLPISANEVNVDQDTGTNLQSRPRVVALSDNNFLITWVDARDGGTAWGRVFNPASRTFVTGEFQIDNSPGNVITQDVAADSNLNFVTVWHEENPQDAIYANIHNFEPPDPILGDLNQDGTVNTDDLLIFTDGWHGNGTGYTVSPDLDDNNLVNGLDLFQFSGSWFADQVSQKKAHFIKETSQPKSRSGLAFARPRAETEAAAGARR